MDSMTHIHFAARLLDACEQSRDALDACLFPQVDRNPAYYHRLYAHSAPKAAQIIAAAKDAYWPEVVGQGVAKPVGAQEDYFRHRLREDVGRISGYVSKSPFADQSSREVPSDDAVLLSFVSHLYNDLYNNPIQAFIPYSVIPSGAWSLWESIDSSEFRWYLYNKETISELRSEVFDDTRWSEHFTYQGMVAAMISELARAAASTIDSTATIQVLESVGLGEVYRTKEHIDAEAFLQDHGMLLESAIRKYSKRVTFDATHPRHWAGEGY